MTSPARTLRPILATFVLTCAFLTATASPARADITAFLGLSPTPGNHPVKGFAVGAGLLVVGFEFEYSVLSEDETEQLPGLTTYSGNVLAQTPTGAVQLYGTLGVQGFRETLNSSSETHVGTNIGGGAKIKLVGPVRVRLDYRIFKLQGSPIHGVYHRFYAGANLKF
ncbi:MAG TPA: outer membrane beta-barrel protein [Vicinamibacterales bacterium]|nr:outer membrane beta-barrel protein [Vicinamibacterales bacterium]